jgi:hypothetical protein
MAVPSKRMPSRKGIPKRRPLNLRTLQMMVQSGVVRRADFDPPSLGSRARFHALDAVDHDSVKEMGSEPGWLTRIVRGRTSQFSLPRRSWKG